MSMQEIIPYIVLSWQEIPDVEVINVDEIKIDTILKKALKAKNIICTCFSVELVSIIKFLRSDMSLDFRLFFYVHGLASVALWPLRKWNLFDIFKQSDVFVVSCKRDIEALKLAVKSFTYALHPFYIKYKTKISKINPYHLVYIGRVSEQKNLHNLLIAFKKLTLVNPSYRLDIIGGYDELGSPNMGIASASYTKYLSNLVMDLNLGESVNFLGHQSRDFLNYYLEDSCPLYVNMSLHSDENFGATPYQILSGGGGAVLSNWGGFFDHAQLFPNQCLLANVYIDDYGPRVDIDHFVSQVLKFQKNPIEKNNSNYDFSETFKSLLDWTNLSSELIIATQFSDDLLAKRERYYNSTENKIKNFGSQIFSSYEDKNAHKLFQSYAGQEEYKPLETKEGDFLYCHPSVKIISSKNAEVDDPHLGQFLINEKSDDMILIKDLKGNNIEICKSLFDELKKLGLIISF